MIQIKLDGVKVETIYYGKYKKERWIEVESIPSPEEIPGKIPVLPERGDSL